MVPVTTNYHWSSSSITMTIINHIVIWFITIFNKSTPPKKKHHFSLIQVAKVPTGWSHLSVRWLKRKSVMTTVASLPPMASQTPLTKSVRPRSSATNTGINTDQILGRTGTPRKTIGKMVVFNMFRPKRWKKNIFEKMGLNGIEWHM